MSFPSQTRPALAPILLTQSESTQTIKARHHFLPLEPPSYLSPAVRALKGSLHVLTPPSNARTKGPFKPRSATRGTSSYQLRRFAEETLGSGSLRKAVRLPEGEDVNEWLAVNGPFISLFYFEGETDVYWDKSGRLL
jgi:MOB kinase activator 1